MIKDFRGKLRRAIRKPPRYLAARLLQEINMQIERYAGPLRASKISATKLAHKSGFRSFSQLWDDLCKRPYLSRFDLTQEEYGKFCPAQLEQIRIEADMVLKREVDILGSGKIALGKPIDWSKDYKTGVRWKNRYCHDIEYSNLDQPSDVKFPWEISRMQWLIAAGQLYCLQKDEVYASQVRDIISEWIDSNPYAMSVNWSCTMDVALRAITWTWLFHAFKSSFAWSDLDFRNKFIKSLWLHGDFTSRHLEKSDINGNHYAADACGLFIVGMFFGQAPEAQKWAEQGWQILCDEIETQVFHDGVDFEASIPYHRLVQELFLYPAIFRKNCGLDIPKFYRDRLNSMAQFTNAYSRPDGSVPLWGDADDARTLPFRRHPINDHRYLIGLAGITLEEPDLLAVFSGATDEIFWFFGADSIEETHLLSENILEAKSQAFSQGGFFVLRNLKDHIFVDCGPIGLGGRGGHGHNDLLSFEAVLNGIHLVSDSGAYLYTADHIARNLYRSTSYHNTPCIDGQEINRFIHPTNLWNLHNDASHIVRVCEFSQNRDRLVVEHDGYKRLSPSVRITREFILDHHQHKLSVTDSFEGEGKHRVDIPLHFAPGVNVVKHTDHIALSANGRSFQVSWESVSEWDCEIQTTKISESYGSLTDSCKAIWSHSGALKPFNIYIYPA